jgi:hypothetical protein
MHRDPGPILTDYSSRKKPSVLNLKKEMKL